jgi:hypothetical protein
MTFSRADTSLKYALWFRELVVDQNHLNILTIPNTVSIRSLTLYTDTYKYIKHCMNYSIKHGKFIISTIL